MMLGLAATKLVSISSDPIAVDFPSLKPETEKLGGQCVSALMELLVARNGFYAFESSLHVFPAATVPGEMGLDLWNSFKLWRSEYGKMAKDGLFFAEDVFGSQFCIFESAIHRFDPETGEMVTYAPTLEQWAARIMADPDRETGFPLAHKWQLENGTLRRGMRLFPKYPFVLGGAFATDNLRAFDAVAGMRFFGSLATQLHDLPDGTKVSIEFAD